MNALVKETAIDCKFRLTSLNKSENSNGQLSVATIKILITFRVILVVQFFHLIKMNQRNYLNIIFFILKVAK